MIKKFTGLLLFAAGIVIIVAVALRRDGFRSMTIGKKLWILIIIKLIIIFCVFKLFFFPDILDRDYDNDVQRADAVRSTLLDR